MGKDSLFYEKVQPFSQKGVHFWVFVKMLDFFIKKDYCIKNVKRGLLLWGKIIKILRIFTPI